MNIIRGLRTSFVNRSFNRRRIKRWIELENINNKFLTCSILFYNYSIVSYTFILSLRIVSCCSSPDYSSLLFDQLLVLYFITVANHCFLTSSYLLFFSSNFCGYFSLTSSTLTTSPSTLFYWCIILHCMFLLLHYFNSFTFDDYIANGLFFNSILRELFYYRHIKYICITIYIILLLSHL